MIRIETQTLSTYPALCGLLLLGIASIGLAQTAPAKFELVREHVLDAKREDFSTVDGGQVNARGDIALTLRQDYEVRLYDLAGKQLARLGRRGRGPGEFLSPQAQGWIGDTLWVFDAPLRRHSFFTRTGTFVRSVALEINRPIPIANEPRGARLVDFFPHVRGRDGSMIGIGYMAGGRTGQMNPSRERIIARYGADGTAIRLATFQEDNRWESSFAYTTRSAIVPDGTEVLLTGVSDLKHSGASIILVRISRNGASVDTVRIPYRGIPFPSARRDSILRRGIGPDRDQSVPASRIPEVMSPILKLLAREDGMAFLVVPRSATSRSVLLIDRKGSVRGEFALPQNSDISMVLGDAVWLRERDSDGLTSVVRYRLRCGTSRCT